MTECRHCKQLSHPPEIVPYYIGRTERIWLHPQCSMDWHKKFRDWIDKKTEGKS